MPSFAPLLAQAAQWAEADAASLSAEAVDRAYGRELLVSVSALENFAACPFKFFVQRGLEAGERQRFEVDPREKGSFQHAVLRAFQEHLAQAGQRWRDLTPDQARQLVRTLGQAHLERFREGLFASDEGRRFVAGLLIEGLEQLIAELVRWNREQYDFDPRFAELEFGPGQRLPGWRITVDEQHALVLRGRLDRVDLCQPAEAPGALAVVVDYKSGEEKFDLRRFQNGLQLQLLAYAAVLRHLPDPFTALGVPAVQPVGVFYVSLRQAAPSAKTRAEALAEAPANRVVPYQHQGRFDARWLRRFDRRPDAERGDQFRYGLNRTGTLHARGDALPTDKFEALLLEVEAQVRRIGRQIFAGQVAPAPYRSGSETACGQCLYRGICRFDPWVQPYRKLNSASASQEA